MGALMCCRRPAAAKVNDDVDDIAARARKNWQTGKNKLAMVKIFNTLGGAQGATMTDAAATALQRIGTGRAREIICNRAKISDAHIQTICDALRSEDGKTITSLQIQNNLITEIGAKSLANVLLHHERLKILYLGRNEINDGGCNALAEALTSNKTLEELNLRSCNISDAGANALANALTTNTSLTELNLNSNAISDPGATALATVLKAHQSMNWLGLKGNKVGDDGAESLFHCLQTNKAIKYIDLNGNSITNAQASQIRKFVSEEATTTKKKRRMTVSVVDVVPAT